MNNMNKRLTDLDMVVLTRDYPEHGLKTGDVGTVVHLYRGGEGYEVEFLTGEGDTVAVLTAADSDLRPLANAEILHVRELARR